MDNIAKKYNENTASVFILIFTIFLIVCFLYYWFVYLKGLEGSECSTMSSMYSKKNGNLRSINLSDPQCSYTLKDYYIKTAYNCCNGGNYSNDFVNTCAMTNILKQGVRGLDFEIFSIDNQPVVASSTSTTNYNYKETYNYVLFSDVFTIINNNAFNSSVVPNFNDPLIIHFRFKTDSQTMYDNLTTILKNYNSRLLGEKYSFQNNGKDLGSEHILKLLGKIVIICDENNTSFLNNTNFMEYVNMTSNSLYMRALNYYDIQYSPDISELTEYNKQGMTIAMPDVSSSPSNMSSVLVRACGCQMIAMRYQLFDSYLEENEIFFNNVGYAFALKPESLRYVPTTIPDPTPQNPALDYSTRTYTNNYYNFSI